MSSAISAPRAATATRSRGTRHSNSIDEIASALLDDTNYQTDNGGRAPSPNRSRAQLPSGRPMPMTTSASTGSTLDGVPLSPLSMHAVFATTTTPVPHRSSPSRVEKTSPRKQRRQLAKRSSTRKRSGSLKQNKATREGDSSGNPAKSPFDDSHEENNDESGLEAFPAFDENAAPSRPEPTTHHGIDADEIERKVAAMLAATEALKPTAPQAKGTAASKVSRMVPSVLAKMSNAWDKLSSRPSTPEATEAAKIRKEGIRHNLGGVVASRSTPHILAPAGRVSIDSTELRRNEGANLNKRKVQKILGASVDCKLTSDSRKSLRTDQAVDVSGGEPTAPQAPSDLEIWRMFVEMGETGTQAQMGTQASNCPFDSEAGFEQNLEDRILNTQPAGSSTPRPGSPCKSANAPGTPRPGSPCESSDASDSKSAHLSGEESLASDVKVNLAEVAVRLGDDEARATIRQVDVKPSDSVKGATSAAGGTNRRVKSNVHNRIDAIKGEERQKKHPSPSKQELEDLEQALQWYLTLENSEPDRHVD